MLGQTVSHYKILEKLGSGGMGDVWKAEDTKLHRDVALKLLASHLLRDEEARKRFHREAQAAAALSHPNVTTIHEIDEADGKTFLALEYIEGETLEQRIEKGPLPLQEALDIARQIAEGLQAAHAKGIVHRDIKPGNVLITPDARVKILDFGLALLTEGSKLTQLDTTVGTIAYMSPEQTQGSGVDHRTDIWSLGVVLYEMVTGQKPFKGDYDKAVMYSILNEEPEPITALRTGVPMQLEDYVGKALAKEAEDRYQSAGDLLIDLRTMARPMNSRGSRTLLTAQPPSTPIDGRSAARTLKLPWMVAGLLAAALTLLAFVHFTEPVEQRPVRRFSFTPRSLLETDYMRAAISPDGRWIVYVSDEGPGSLWIRPIDSEGSYKLEGTDGAWLGPFWSPDNRYVGFASDGQLKKVAVAGETPLVVCELPAGSTLE